MLGIESRFALDRDQLSIDSTVLGGKTTLKEIKADADLTKNTGAGNKYTRLKTGKIRMKIEKWRHAFEMNGIIPSKQDLKTYEKFLQLLIRAPAGACRQNILEMVYTDAMTEEGEYHFCDICNFGRTFVHPFVLIHNCNNTLIIPA